jgi:MSHA biogenesis protein MshJ
LILARAQQDPNRPLRARQQELIARLTEVDQAIRARAGDFIQPERMGRLLEELLAAQSGLRLLRLETLKPEPIRLGDDAGSVAPVYRHGLLLEFSGDYAATLRFLNSVEAMSWRFFWDRLEYEVVSHPEAKIVLRIHTLSTREAAIGV